MGDTVYVIMGNDFPNAVFSTEAAAKKYCVDRLAADKAEAVKENRWYGTPRIYWREYAYVVDERLEMKQ